MSKFSDQVAQEIAFQANSVFWLAYACLETAKLSLSSENANVNQLLNL